MLKFNEFKASIFEKISIRINDFLWHLHQKKINKMKKDGSMLSSSYKQKTTIVPLGQGDIDVLD